MQYIHIDLVEQQKDHQLSQQHLMKTNQSLAQIDLLNIMSRYNYHTAVFDNVKQWAMYLNNNKTF